MSLLSLVLVASVINLPLGYFRQNFHKFTFGWYFFIHLSIPFLIYLRIKAGFDWHMIPFTLIGAAAGQFLGGKLNKNQQIKKL